MGKARIRGVDTDQYTSDRKNKCAGGLLDIYNTLHEMHEIDREIIKADFRTQTGEIGRRKDMRMRNRVGMRTGTEMG